MPRTLAARPAPKWPGPDGPSSASHNARPLAAAHPSPLAAAHPRPLTTATPEPPRSLGTPGGARGARFAPSRAALASLRSGQCVAIAHAGAPAPVN